MRSLTSSLAIAALVAVAACSRCSGPAPAPTPPKAAAPAPGDALLVVDGITITFGEVQVGVDYFDTLDEVTAHRVKMQRYVDDYLLPLKLAQREFAAQRKELLQRAQALRAVSGNVLELKENGKQFELDYKTVAPRDVETPIARWLFDKLHQGAVSDPIELPQGWIVVGSIDLQEAGIATADRCEALQVPFYTHDRRGWKQWLDGLQSRLPAKLTYFHPDYRDAVPRWLLP